MVSFAQNNAEVNRIATHTVDRIANHAIDFVSPYRFAHLRKFRPLPQFGARKAFTIYVSIVDRSALLGDESPARGFLGIERRALVFLSFSADPKIDRESFRPGHTHIH